MDDLREAVRQFAEARDWEKFHSPKNLAMGVAAEAGEPLEIFLWLSESEGRNLDEKQLAALKAEIGDIVIYLVNLANQFDLDLLACAQEKLRLNEQKYPADIVRGSAKKYTDY